MDLRRVVDVVGEGLVGADALARARSGSTAAGVARPRPARAGGAPAASPDGPLQGGERGVRDVGDGAQAEPAAAPPRCAPPPPTARRPAAGAGSVTTSSRGTTTIPSGLARPEASLATNLVAATPTEQVMPCSSCDGVAERARRSAPGEPSRRTAPDTSRNASSSESGSTTGVTERKVSITAAETAAVEARGRAGARRPAGTAAGPGPSASPRRRRSGGPRRWPRAPRRGCRRRR